MMVSYKLRVGLGTTGLLTLGANYLKVVHIHYNTVSERSSITVRPSEKQTHTSYDEICVGTRI